MKLKQLEQNLKGLANQKRLLIIKFLIEKKQASVSDIAEHIDLSFRSTSKHLNILFKLDIIDQRREYTYIFYRISDTLSDVVKDFLKYLA